MSHSFRPNYQCAVVHIIAALLFNFLSADIYAEKSSSSGIAASDSLTQPIIISVKGGISKGSYQAGLNWGLLRFFKHINSEFSDPSADGLYKNRYGQKLKFDLSVYVGSSAGNINGLTSAIEWCRNDFLSRDPEESLFWNVWTPVGINQLFPHEKADSKPRAVFTRKYFDEILFATLQSYIKNQNMVDNCSVAVGVTLTRQQPQKISIGDATDNLLIDSQRSVSIFEASVDTKSVSGNRLTFRHHPSTAIDNPFNTNPAGYGQLVLPPFNSNEEDNDFLVFKLSEASSAFPLLFEPVELKYYDHRGVDETSLLKTANFLDGGAFDNNPLSLGLKLYEYEKKRRGYKRPATLIYLDPNNRRDSTDDKFQDKRVDFGIGALTGFLGGFISSARQYELEVFARDKDALDDLNLSITSNGFTIISYHLKSFGAFLGRPFREFDFYVGIYDALHFVSKNFLCENKNEMCLYKNITELANSLELDHSTKIYIAYLLEDEFGKKSTDSLMINSDITLSKEEKIISYLLEANSTFLKQNGDIDYTVDDFIKFMEMLRSFDDGEFLKLIDREAQDCKNLRRGYPERFKYRVDCYVDPFLIDIVQSPGNSMYELAEQFAYKLWRVERETGETDFEKIPEFSQYFLIHNHVHRQTGLNWSNTIPRRNWKRNKSRQKKLTFLTEWFFPYEIQTSVSTGIMSFRYNTLQYRINKNFSVQLPATLFESYRKDETYFGVGAGGRLHTNNTLLGLDARVNYQHKWKSPFDFNEQLVGGEIGFILGTKVRLAIQNKTLFSGHSKLNNKTFFTVGIVDLNGILYWLVRTSR